MIYEANNLLELSCVGEYHDGRLSQGSCETLFPGSSLVVELGALCFFGLMMLMSVCDL